jgi:hypothetical protein
MKTSYQLVSENFAKTWHSHLQPFQSQKSEEKNSLNKNVDLHSV